MTVKVVRRWTKKRTASGRVQILGMRTLPKAEVLSVILRNEGEARATPLSVILRSEGEARATPLA